MRNVHKLTGERLKSDPYIGVCEQALETAEHLCKRIDYCKSYGTRH